MPANDRDKDKTQIEILKAEETIGMKRTQSWVSMWQQNLEYFLSEQLEGKASHKDWTWVVLNYIWPAIMQETAKLSRHYPKIITNPVEDTDTEGAETWQGLLQWLWENGLSERGMRLDQVYAIVIGKIWGYRISKVFWEPKPDGGWDDTRKQWIGQCRHRLWHPAEFWSGENEFINEGNCGTVRYADLEWAQSQWPEFKRQLSDHSVSYKEAYGGEHIRGQRSTGSTIATIGTGEQDEVKERPGPLLDLVHKAERMSGMQTEHEQDRRFVKISEAYRKNREETSEKEEAAIPIEEMAPQGYTESDSGLLGPDQQPVEPWPVRTVREWKQPKYPNGRYIIRCVDSILNPKHEDQVYPYSRWPFVITPHYLLPFMWQGTDAIQLYKRTQDMINVTASHMVNNMKQFGDPRIAIEEDALAQDARGKRKKAYKIFRGAGAIIRLARGGLKKYKIEQPVPLGSGNLALYQLFAQEFKNITGLHDVAQGKKAPGTQTKGEVQLLAISANDRVYLQSIFEDDWVKRVSTLSGEIAKRHYDVGRIIRIVGQDRIASATEITQGLKDLKYDVSIEAGTTLPFDEERRIEKYQAAYEMMQQPIANPMLPEMLRVLEISGWQKLLEKYEAWQQYFAFYQLYESVKAGEVLPEDAVAMLVQKARQLYQQEQANTVPAQEKGQNQNA